MSTPAGWRNYEDFASGIATNRLPRTDALAGSELEIALVDGSSLGLSFRGPDAVDWHRDRGGAGEAAGSDRYEAVEAAAGVFFLDLTFASRPKDALTLVASPSTRRVLSILSRVADEAVPGEPQVGQEFTSGVIAGGGDATGEEPAPTRDLIGRRALYRYSPDHLYEHTYLSSERYAWQCLQGVQRGHGDVDLTTTYRFAPNQYVFTFREFLIPVASVFFFDLEGLRSTGKFLGVTGAGAIENNPAGAHIIPLGQVDYPDGVAPV